MWDAIGFETHYPGAGCICGNCIVCENEGPEWPSSGGQWSVSFHGHDAVGDHKVNRDCGTNIQKVQTIADSQDDPGTPSPRLSH